MIKLTDKVYIKADTNNYTLTEKTIVQDENSKNYGKEIFKDIGYYPTIEMALNGYMTATTRKYISSEQENSIKELKEQIKQTKEFLQSLNLKF